jgi:hypothetical protein
MSGSWNRIALRTLGSIAVLILVFSCGESPTNEPVPGVSFVVEPATVRDCDPPAVAKVSWNAPVVGLKTVKVFVLEKDRPETLFVNAGVVGTATTGAWVGAKTVFVLRDGDNSKQLARFTVGSKSCN